MTLTLHLLGPFDLRARDGQPLALGAARLQALVTLLTLAEGRPVPRPRLWDLLWEGRGEEQARNSLRQALTALRKAFPESEGFPFRITATDASVLPGTIETDLDRLAGEASALAGPPPWAEPLAGLLLPGAGVQDWLREVRRICQERYARIVLAEAGRRHEVSDYAGALEWAEAGIAADPLDESGHRLLMRAAAAAGDRVRALRQFESLRGVLSAELGVAPSAESEALRREIGGSSPVVAGVSQPAPANAPPAEAPDVPSVVVLPLEDMSATPSARRIAELLTDALTAELSRFHDLHVTAAYSAVRYRDDPDPRRACDDLGVRFALSGTVLYEGERLRVQLRLVDGQDGRVVWSERYDRSGSDEFSLLDDLTETVVSTLATTFGGRLRRAWQKTRARGDPGYHASDLFSQAIDTIDTWTPEGVAEGRRLLLRAIELDPSLAKGRAKLAWTYLIEAADALGDDVETAFAAGVAAAEEALRCDPSEPWAVWVHGATQFYRGQAALGLKSLEKAVELNPNDADLLMDHAYYLGFAGEARRGREVAAKAMRLNPHYPEWYLLAIAQIEFDARDYAASRATGERLVSVESAPARLALAASAAALGDDAAARAEIERALTLDPDATIARWSDMRRIPYARAEDLAHWQENLRRAGLPEGGAELVRLPRSR